MKWLRNFFKYIRKWFMNRKIIDQLSIALGGLNAIERKLVDKWLDDQSKDEIFLILSCRRLKNKLIILLKDAGYSESNIIEIFEKFKYKTDEKLEEAFKRITAKNPLKP